MKKGQLANAIKACLGFAAAIAAPANAKWREVKIDGECAVGGTFEGSIPTDVVFAVRNPVEYPSDIWMVVVNDGWSAKADEPADSKFDFVMGDESVDAVPYAYVDNGMAFAINWDVLRWMNRSSLHYGLYILKDGNEITGLNMDGFYSAYHPLSRCVARYTEIEAEKKRKAKLESDYPADPFAD